MKNNNLSFCVNLSEDIKYSQGVYKIYHKENPNKFYIGSAASTKKYGGFLNRFRCHIQDLKNNRHRNDILQKISNKYGVDGIRIEILEVCKPDKCIEREQYYIDTLNPFINICKTAGNTLGVKLSRELLIKRSKPVLQYDLEGNFIGEYISATEASTLTGTKSSLITQCCNKDNVLRGGNFQWKYKKQNNYPLKIDKYYKPTSKRILCYDESGNFVKIFSSILEASKELNIPCGNISKHLSDNTSSCYTYVFKNYVENFDKKISIRKRVHKNQYQVEVFDKDLNKTLLFDSFRKTPSYIIARSTLKERVSKEIFQFTHKKRYNIKITKYN